MCFDSHYTSISIAVIIIVVTFILLLKNIIALTEVFYSILQSGTHNKPFQKDTEY